MSSSIHVVGALKKSDNCIHCYVDVNSGTLVSPCKDHKPLQKIKTYNKNRDDRKKQIEMKL